jgi:localization factor PodJL
LPPFPENLPQQAAQFAQSTPGGSFDLPPPPYDLAPAPGTENMYSPPSYFANGEFQQPQAVNPASVDSYIASARRNSRAATAPAERTARAPNGNFSWGAPQQAAVAARPAKKGRSKFVLIGVLAVLAFGFAIAATLLSQKFKGTTQPQSQTVQNTPQPPASMPNYNVLPPAEPTTTEGVDQSKPSNQAATTAPKQKATTAPSSPQIAAPPPAKPAASPMERLSALANAGTARAETALGLKYLDGVGVAANEAEAARWLERAALQGEAVAAYRLGTLYERGHGVPADKAKAVRWYTVAANGGNRKAMHNLAVAYAEGSGAKKDMAQAANWFTKAAALGLADSQFNLAVLYERGMGVPQSLINAYKWYAVAASQGDGESKARIDALSTQLSPADRDTAQRAAASFKPQPMDRATNAAPDASEFAGG